MLRLWIGIASLMSSAAVASIEGTVGTAGTVRTMGTDGIQSPTSKEDIGTLQWISAPAGDLSAAAVAAHLGSFKWQTLENGEAQTIEAHHDYFYRFHAPASLDSSYVIQTAWFQAAKKEVPLHGNLYVLSHPDSKTKRQPQSQPPELRSLPIVTDNFAAFRISKKDYDSDLLFKASASSLPRLFKIEFVVHSNSEFEYQKDLYRTMFGFIAGIIAIMIFYNFGTQLQYNKRYIFYHAVYSTSGLYWHFFRSGMMHYSNLANGLFYGSIWGLEVGMTLFSVTILETKKLRPVWYRFGLSLMILSSVSLLLTLSGLSIGINCLYLCGIPSCCFCLVLTVGAAKQEFRPAYAMLFGWAALFAATLLHLSTYYVQGMPDLGWVLELAAAIEVASFSYAMGLQMHQSELNFQEQNFHAFAEMSKMIYPHQLERIRQGEHLEQTMPTHSAQACVISLDLVGSSTIKHINAKDFFRLFFARCNALMAEGYNGQDLTANAYRVKEMGDGFLCSIGYPFKSITRNPANDAVDLARRFIQVLATESAMLHSETPICCGVGIALDSLTGFYPEAGTKEYDLYGNALVLATRYEGMRKILPQLQAGRSVIIIQAAVFASLDPQHREGFVAVDLKEGGVTVRDDAGASKLYFQMLGNVPTQIKEDSGQKPEGAQQNQVVHLHAV